MAEFSATSAPLLQTARRAARSLLRARPARRPDGVACGVRNARLKFQPSTSRPPRRSADGQRFYQRDCCRQHGNRRASFRCPVASSIARPPVSNEPQSGWQFGRELVALRPAREPGDTARGRGGINRVTSNACYRSACPTPLLRPGARAVSGRSEPPQAQRLTRGHPRSSPWLTTTR